MNVHSNGRSGMRLSARFGRNLALLFVLATIVLFAAHQNSPVSADDQVTDFRPAVLFANSPALAEGHYLNDGHGHSVDDFRPMDGGEQREIEYPEPLDLIRPNLRNPLEPYASRTANVMAVDNPLIDMKLLVLHEGTGPDGVLDTIEGYSDNIGIPYDKIDITTTTIDDNLLWDGNNRSYYQAVMMTTSNVWANIDAAEKQAIIDLEANFGLRRVTWYAFPNAADHGLDFVDNPTFPTDLTLSAEGADVFSYLKSDVVIPVEGPGLFGYRATAAVGADVTPMLSDSDGNIFLAKFVSADNREHMVLTISSFYPALSPAYLHSRLLPYGLINWATKGQFIGDRHHYFSPQPDDVLIRGDRWNPDTHSIDFSTYRLDGDGLNALADWQNNFVANTPNASDFRIEIPYNGVGISEFDEDASGNIIAGTVSDVAQQRQDDFWWLNHTFTHDFLNIGSIPIPDYAFSLAQIQDNHTAANRLGFDAYDTETLLTGAYSGIEPPNPDLAQAAADAGIKYLTVNYSVPGYSNPSPNTGIPHPLQSSVLQVPRYANNMFYNVRTQAEEVDLYNWIFCAGYQQDPDNTPQCYDYDYVLENIKNQQFDFVVQGSVNASMFHQPNVMDYGDGRTLLTDYTEALFETYNSYYNANVPILSLRSAEIGQKMQDRMDFNASGITGQLSCGNQITLQTSQAATIPITGRSYGATTENYAGQDISQIEMGAGSTVVIPGNGVQQPAQVSGFTGILVGNDTQLNWSAVTTDTNGDPIALNGYRIYGQAGTGSFTPSASNLLGTSTTNSFIIADSGTTAMVYIVTAVSSDCGTPESAPSDPVQLGGGVEPPTCTTGLQHEVWFNVDGTELSDLLQDPRYPGLPDETNTIANFETPSDIAESYGQRVRGYIVPPITGDYTFWVSADDRAELFLSSDDGINNLQSIASVPNWTPPQQWDWFADQKSAPISLVAGEKYYVEALMKEIYGNDNLAVAWEVSGVERELIGEQYLCQFEPSGEAPTAVLNVSNAIGPAPHSVQFDASSSTDSDGTIVSYQWDFGDGSSATGAMVSHTYVAAGIYTAKLIVTDNDGLSDSKTQTMTIAPGAASCQTSGLLLEYWTNGIEGNAVTDLTGHPSYPNSPSGSRFLTDYADPSQASNDGKRVRGYVTAPETGAYTFWLASDDNGSLLLSSDSNPANAAEIASVPVWTPPQQWDWFVEQKSAEINLVAGEIYYIESLSKNGVGEDNVAVAWKGPGINRQVIPVTYLCPFEGTTNNNPPTVNIVADPVSGVAPLSVAFDGSGSTDDGSIVAYNWTFTDGGTSSDATVDHVFVNPGTYNVELAVTDNDGNVSRATVSIEVYADSGFSCTTENGMLWEYFTGIPGFNVSDLTSSPNWPNNPTGNQIVPTLEAPFLFGADFGARMRGYITAPESGEYRFWISSDDQGEFWMSTDTNPANATLIASVVDHSDRYEYTKWSEQKSVLITLEAGETYYVETRHKDGFSIDHLSVAWQRPSMSELRIVENEHLCAYGGTAFRTATEDAPVDALFSTSAFGRNTPASVYSEFGLLLVSDATLRGMFFDIRAEFEAAMSAEDGVVSAELIAEMTNVYEALQTNASESSASWLQLAWDNINLSQYEGASARTAWAEINELDLMPNKVFLPVVQ